jgi:membrane-bound ClpP family serine protease
MWVIAGVLLGLVVLASLLGIHIGPHGHVLAGVFGAVAAGWLVWMVVDGRSLPVLWALLSADIVVSAGVGSLAYRGLKMRGAALPTRHLAGIEGAEGVAVGDLGPRGIVRVQGENWSAVCVNGMVQAGAPVQVIGARGVQLEVWGEHALPVLLAPLAVDAAAVPAGSSPPTLTTPHVHGDGPRP